MSVSPVVRLPGSVDVVNIGLPLFESALRDQGQQVIGVDWRIPGGGVPEVVAALTRLLGPKAERIDRANAEVIRRLNEGVPMLVGVETASAVIPGLGARDVLHSGPSIAWADMPDPLQRSIRASASMSAVCVPIGGICVFGLRERMRAMSTLDCGLPAAINGASLPRPWPRKRTAPSIIERNTRCVLAVSPALCASTRSTGAGAPLSL